MTVQKHGQNMTLQNSDVDDVASSVRGVLGGRQGRLRKMTIFQFLLDTQFRNFVYLSSLCPITLCMNLNLICSVIKKLWH